MKVKLTIHSYYPSLTKSEQKVADYILQCNQDIMNQTLSDIAKLTQVGEATVIRFCNKVGFDKLSTLKLSLAKDLDQEEQENKDEDTIDYLESELTRVISNSANVLQEQALAKAVGLIENANTIYLYGVGASGISAQMAESNFLRVGRLAKAITDSHFQSMNSALIQPNDLVIAFSLTGNTKDVYDACVMAKEANANIIAITSYVESSLAKLAHVCLLTAAKEQVLRGGSLSSTLSQLFVIDAIKMEYSKRNEEKVRAYREKTAKSIINKSL
ncbi:MAG: MurR/RpiR family transcriptional regulator [Erysipelotrichaceae bacterium]